MSTSRRMHDGIWTRAVWLGLRITATLAGLLLFSLWGTATLFGPWRTTFGIRSGCWTVHVSHVPPQPDPTGFTLPRFFWPRSHAFTFSSDAIDTYVALPLWVPLILVAMPTALAWRIERRIARRAGDGRCTGCGYDRHGLAAEGVCPECGAGAKAGVAS